MSSRRRDATLDYWPGDVTDFENLKQALTGMDLLFYMAMNIQRGDPLAIEHSSFDVNVKGVYLAMKAAHEVGITHAVHCSTMSVYDGALEVRYFFDEGDGARCARHVWLYQAAGCKRSAAMPGTVMGSASNALRMCHPVSREKWLEQARIGVPSIPTNAEDVARLMLAAMEYRNGFQAFLTSGDYENKIMNMGKAKRLLGWEPLARPIQS